VSNPATISRGGGEISDHFKVPGTSEANQKGKVAKANVTVFIDPPRRKIKKEKKEEANLIYCAFAEYQTLTLSIFLMKYGSFNEGEMRLFKRKTRVSQKVKKIEG